MRRGVRVVWWLYVTQKRMYVTIIGKARNRDPQLPYYNLKLFIASFPTSCEVSWLSECATLRSFPRNVNIGSKSPRHVKHGAFFIHFASPKVKSSESISRTVLLGLFKLEQLQELPFRLIFLWFSRSSFPSLFSLTIFLLSSRVIPLLMHSWIGWDETFQTCIKAVFKPPGLIWKLQRTINIIEYIRKFC